MRAAHDVPVVSVLAVDDHAAFLVGRHALASAWARFGPHRAPDGPVAATAQGARP